ncbi:hypothetical protein GCM10012287_50560 [Streptomyces daqingensis]|uniref:Uncharacterized protein n=1 Tax=Streptomyces daqingensis TaxID=1472640 RepID=A0ABQ2MPY0_9ACTN|nr:hypothetical protein GCM10012287_50560 [Streptomyces daqingensis]
MSDNFLYYFKGSLRSPRGPARRRADAPVSAPLRPGHRPAREDEPEEEGYIAAGAVGSKALATCPVRDPRRARPGGHSDTLRAGDEPARVANKRTAP